MSDALVNNDETLNAPSVESYESANNHKSGGLAPDHDLEIFRAWQKALPHYDWTKATLDSKRGLTLIAPGLYGDETRLHLAHATCGYRGSGPHASVWILSEAGFGSHEEIYDAVVSNSYLEVSR